jgi:ketosteroid isomerase-like protein
MAATQADHPNAALARRLYETLSEGDLAAYLELLADDVVFHVGGDSIVAGEHRGKDAVINLGVKVLEETAGTYRTDLLGVLANDSHAVTLHHWSAERRGRRIAMNNFNVHRVEDRQVVERWEFIEDRLGHDQFWAP